MNYPLFGFYSLNEILCHELKFEEATTLMQYSYVYLLPELVRVRDVGVDR